MYFFGKTSQERIKELCTRAIQEGVCIECKHSNAESGLSCFYMNCDDLKAHRRILHFFIENRMISRTKSGNLTNISFKRDEQTQTGQYGEAFGSPIKLDHYLDLKTGEWKLGDDINADHPGKHIGDTK